MDVMSVIALVGFFVGVVSIVPNRWKWIYGWG
jgi:hypothetical protein